MLFALVLLMFILTVAAFTIITMVGAETAMIALYVIGCISITTKIYKGIHKRNIRKERA